MPRTAPSRPRRRLPRFEQLERRDLPSGFAPTAVEQQTLEELNDIRANPPAYSDWAGVDLSAVAPSQPLAFNPLLVEAARLHSQDMNDHNIEGHVGSDGSDPAARVAAAGFAAVGGPGESVAVGPGMTPDAALAGFIQDFGQPAVGHRRHLLAIDDAFKPHNQIGIGIVLNGGGVEGNYYTLDTGYDADPRPFLTGVVYNDANGDGHYEAGEGLSGVTLTVAGVGAFPAFDTGGYSIRLAPGTYTVTASGGLMAAPVTTTVTVGSTNYRLNFIGHNPVSWASAAPLPAARSQLLAATDGSGRVYALGGQDATGGFSTEVDVYTPATGTWGSAAPLPQVPVVAAVSGADGKIYGLGEPNTVNVYDPAADRWTTLTSDPVPGTLDEVEVAGGPDGKIYVFGGQDATNFPLTTLATVRVFDPAAAAGQRWSTLPDMPIARAGGTAVLGPDGNIYLLGADGFGGAPPARVDVFHPATDSWSQAPSIPYAPFSGAAAATGADGRIYVVAATLPGAPSVQTYQPSTGTWASAPDLLTPRTNLAVTAGADGTLYVLGGMAATTGPAGSVNFSALSAAVETFATAATQEPVASFTLLSYPGPPLPPGVGPGATTVPKTDVTGQVSVSRARPHKVKGRWQQTLTLRNAGGTTLVGPFRVVVRGLKRSVRLRGAAGFVGTRKKKSPFVMIPASGLQPGASIGVTLQFSGRPNAFAVSVLAATTAP
jgi:uncharacterized protein YkwD